MHLSARFNICFFLKHSWTVILMITSWFTHLASFILFIFVIMYTFIWHTHTHTHTHSLTHTLFLGLKEQVAFQVHLHRELKYLVIRITKLELELIYCGIMTVFFTYFLQIHLGHIWMLRKVNNSILLILQNSRHLKKCVKVLVMLDLKW